MFFFIDQWIIRKLKKWFHSKRDDIVEASLTRFKKKYYTPHSDELSSKLHHEANRIYPIVDRSILRDRVIRAKYTFWFISISGTLCMGMMGHFFHGANWSLLAPTVAATFNWVIGIATIHISYNQRVKGAMDSVMATYIQGFDFSEANNIEIKHIPLPKQQNKKIEIVIDHNDDKSSDNRIPVVTLPSENPSVNLEIKDQSVLKKSPGENDSQLASTEELLDAIHRTPMHEIYRYTYGGPR